MKSVCVLAICALLANPIQAFNPFEVLSNIVKVPGVNSFRRNDDNSNSQQQPGFTGTLFKLLADNFIKPEIERRKVSSSENSENFLTESKKAPQSKSGQ